MPGPLSAKVSVALRRAVRQPHSEATLRPLYLMALCSKLRVSSRSAHSWARAGALAV